MPTRPCVRAEPSRAAAFRRLLLTGSALFLGLSLVAVPALGTVLIGPVGLSPTEYGALFVPQVVLSVLGAVVGGGLARRAGLRALLALTLLAITLSHALLAGLAGAVPAAAFPLALAAAAALGFGFGLSAAPLNSLPGLLFPTRAHSALVAAHSLVGLGLALGPLAAGPLVVHGRWFLLPILLFGAGSLCLAGLACVPLPGNAPDRPATGHPGADRHPLAKPQFWAFAAGIGLYAVTEGMFSNWGVIFLRDDRSLAETTATLALAMFWLAIVSGRLLVSALVLRLRASLIWQLLPPLMIMALLTAPAVAGPNSAVLLFAFAGLSCSAFLPLGIALAVQRFPAHAAWVSSMLVAALMTGVGATTLVVGALRDAGWSFDLLYRLAALGPLAALLLAVWLTRRPPVSAEAATPTMRVPPGRS